MKTTLSQFFRYGLVGLFSNALCYLVYLAITTAGIEHKLAMTLLYAAGVAQTFFFNKRWSFKHSGTQGPALLRYCASYALGYLINLVALLVLVDDLGYPHQIVQGILVLSLAVLLFLLQKFWVFRPSSTLPISTGSSL